MNVQQQSFARRGFLRGALAAAVLVPMAGSIASCAGGGGGGTTGPTGTVSDTNPFGMADKSTVDAVIFKGGYGIDYVDFAGKGFENAHSGSTAKISPSTDIAQELQPRFVGGNPPDLIDNSGAKAIGFSTILAQLEDLTSVVNAKNLEGKVIKDTLYGGVLAPGTFEGKLAALNYVLTVYAMWYSDALLKDNGWSVPKTWDEMYALGEQAKAKGKYLFVWGKEAATYYQEMAISSAIKEGGHDVRLGLENLKADCWSHPALQSVFTALNKIVKAGHFKPGGSGTQFTAAQAQWSNAQEAVFYPSGSWIENEMKDQTKSGFKMTGAPVPSVTTSSKLPYASLHSAAGEPFVVPSQGKNVPGGKELLRVMLSKDAATNFAKTKLAPTIVKDTVPSDGFGSTALVSQTKLLSDAGDNIYTWNFIDLYGTNKDQLVVWNTFLDGKSDVATLTSDLQKITDKVRNDSSVKKIEVK
ncbi:N-acetylglucosamine/diacetylchitobiose ABC transporter substrate-binding protein [Arthrobacter sp. FW306-2-2C-D06B]|uniref:N-acetylglucosamine/diacetylchitobiose ABC transporter substrate-binding protein n=1 Tax=Arthrobacter sp. FW306-2-2C-D06B TaxID=2879618 RepID=UPI001F0295D2|nr:N-acetylglucosamine/diacetylchitobiose ABC transporter substrate-binding protein [Arthrobacter sp. FW306-2-2C-D06B]UKA59110.1 N-acetylglucosamine/diacetylchitobiose ABC transporter substrate-binding protein [Arthrobacter sp. FW306-2-2C-D06B]